MKRQVFILLIACATMAAAFVYSFDHITSNESIPADLIRQEMTFLYLVLVAFMTIGAATFAIGQYRSRHAQAESRAEAELLKQEISTHQKSDETLQAAKEVAEAASKAKSKYIGGISHELRTPLNAIIGYSQLLESEEEIPERWRPGLRVIRNSGHHISSLIDGLLDISMIEAGRLQIFRDEVRIAEFVESVAETIRLQAREKGIEFRVEIPDNMPEAVYTDEKRLRQILLNLLTNAVRATKEGHVTLRMKYRSMVTTIEVEDTGIGIAPDDLDRIFQPFEQATAERANMEAGSGLGLTITKLMTEAMGGSISVRSTPNVGTCFSLQLMLAFVANPRNEAAPLRKIAGYEGDRKTILVTDDDPNQLSLMTDIFGPLGFNVLTAPDGYTSIDMVEEHQPDLLLLDISMPDISGWDVIRILRDEKAATVPIAIISANPRNEADTEEFSHTLRSYIMKPVNIPDLLETTRDILGLTWIYDDTDYVEADTSFPTDLSAAEVPTEEELDELRALGEIGHVRGVLSYLDELEERQPDLLRVLNYLRATMHDIDFTEFDNTLNRLEAFDG